MSSPIKPPGKTPGVGPTPEAGSTGKATETFQKALDETAAASAAAGPEKAAAKNAISALAQEVAAGRIDVRNAVDQLVSRALESSTASALPPARRAELEAHLRRALADDPTLAALTQDLERGG
jgi:hypothetical protein